MSATEAEAEIIATYGQISVEDKIDIAVQLSALAAQLYASAWAQCPEIRILDPELN
ncbi:MAG: hypothetical protein WDN00_03410 [Limisphaerales bacterium]